MRNVINETWAAISEGFDIFWMCVRGFMFVVNGSESEDGEEGSSKMKGWREWMKISREVFWKESASKERERFEFSATVRWDDEGFKESTDTVRIEAYESGWVR